jgi:hypothetical protein
MVTLLPADEGLMSNMMKKKKIPYIQYGYLASC